MVDEELVRAICCESSLAIQYWFGVGGKAVWKWRKQFGVEKLNEGSKRLRVNLNQKYAADLRGKKLPPNLIEKWRKAAIEFNKGEYLKHGYHGPWWTQLEIDLLGKLPDDEIAKMIGRTASGVRQKRIALGIAMEGKKA